MALLSFIFSKLMRAKMLEMNKISVLSRYVDNCLEVTDRTLGIRTQEKAKNLAPNF